MTKHKVVGDFEQWGDHYYTQLTQEIDGTKITCLAKFDEDNWKKFELCKSKKAQKE
jgi:hypothetical protein